MKANSHLLLDKWQMVTLESIASPVKNAIVDGPFGSNLKLSDYVPEGIPVLQGKNITGNKFVWSGIRFISTVKANELIRSKVEVGDILMVKIGSIGYSAIIDNLQGYPFAIIPANLAKISPDAKKVNSKFLVYYLNSNKVRDELINLSSKTAQPALSLSKIKSLSIPLPSLPEQERIVRLLDEAQALRATRERANVRMEQFVPALFHEMFGDPATNEKKWGMGTVGDVVYEAKDGPHVSPKYVDSGVPLLSTRNIRPGKVIWEDLRYISEDEAKKQWQKVKPEYGDILYTKGGTTGIAKAIDFHRDIAVWVHIAALKTNHNLVDYIWLENMLNSNYCYQQSQNLTHGIANRDLGLTRMINIQIFLPPLALQHEFAVRVGKARGVQSAQGKSTEKIEALYQSMLSRAFAGEL